LESFVKQGFGFVAGSNGVHGTSVYEGLYHHYNNPSQIFMHPDQSGAPKIKDAEDSHGQRRDAPFRELRNSHSPMVVFTRLPVGL
jgi:hypothetical protein